MKHEYVYGAAIFGFVLFAPVIAGVMVEALAWLFKC